jgi:hypothetical protein
MLLKLLSLLKELKIKERESLRPKKILIEWPCPNTKSFEGLYPSFLIYVDLEYNYTKGNNGITVLIITLVWRNISFTGYYNPCK